MALALIDKQDNVEIVRDQIAALLAVETSNQQTLATQAVPPQDPELYALRVYTERANPWEQVLNASPDDATARRPIVNVWFDTWTPVEGASNVIEKQVVRGTFNVDSIGFGVSRQTDEGHDPGDYEAAMAAHRAARLVRNILMAAENTYLKLRPMVGQRMPQSLTSFQPQADNTTIQHAVGIRLALEVRFQELSPQVEPEELELLSARIERAEDGELLVQADYDYT